MPHLHGFRNSLLLVGVFMASSVQAEEITPSSSYLMAMPQGPTASTRITPEYAALVARDAFFWAWPIVNIFNRRLAFRQLKDFALSGGIVPIAPLNHLTMLTDYIAPEERIVACPNQDVVYGNGVLALDLSPVVIQVPNFGDRFWVYQVVDTRSDGFADLGKMYGTTPGFYLLVGPNWSGEVPKGITRVFRSTTNSGVVIPRVFQGDTPEDKKAVQTVLGGVMMYPLSEFDGVAKTHDWTKVESAPSMASGSDEVKWVPTDKFIDTLPLALKDHRFPARRRDTLRFSRFSTPRRAIRPSKPPCPKL
jgi:hypothetical protein